jgi:hypothetical protein
VVQLCAVLIKFCINNKKNLLKSVLYNLFSWKQQVLLPTQPVSFLQSHNLILPTMMRSWNLWTLAWSSFKTTLFPIPFPENQTSINPTGDQLPTERGDRAQREVAVNGIYVSRLY